MSLRLRPIRAGAGERSGAPRLQRVVLFVGLIPAAAFSILAAPFESTTGPAASQRTPLTELLARAGAYVSEYENKLSAVVAREQYVQQVKERSRGPAPPGAGFNPEGYTRTRELNPDWTGARSRTMTSDVLMVQLPDKTWFGFRDVIVVDGHPVGGRENRLQELFVKAQSSARRIVDESSRYNIGPIIRNLNIPTFALLYLLPDCQPGFSFDLAGDETIGDTNTTVVTFVETRRPTIVRDRDRDRDLVSRGRYWIERRTGVVYRSELMIGDVTTDVRSQITVTYEVNSTLGMPVPVAMKESYEYPSRPWDPYIECSASYSNFRRFEVKVEEKIIIKAPRD
jgi:hypothetical protein